MKIERMNVDFGNSMFMTLVDGYYFEMPTNVEEIDEVEAGGLITTPIEEKKDLLKQLLISTIIDDKERFFIVGEFAEKRLSADRHITKPHNKVTSLIPYVTFLAGAAYYHAIKGKEDDHEINDEYFSTMLPVWLLKQESKFSEMQKRMADRFLGEHRLKVLTKGAENELVIKVSESVCRNEGEVGRWAIKKDFDLEDNPAAEQFKDNVTVLVDLGGGTTDLALLPAGLKSPIDRDSMDFIPQPSYLNELEKLRKEKLLDLFDNVRELELFIVKNYKKPKMIRSNGNTGENFDVTETIKGALKKYAQQIIPKIEDTFPAPMDKEYKYGYLGGEAPILQEAILEVVTETSSAEIAEKNHVFLPEARKLNLFGLEILSRDVAKKKEKAKAK